MTSPLTTRLIRSSASSSSTAPPMKPELARRLLAALAEVTLVEGEAEFSVLEHEVFAGAVIPASVHGPSASYVGFLPGARCERDVAAIGGRRREVASLARRGDFLAAAGSDEHGVSPATILIVEDHQPTRTFLADNLAADGYEPARGRLRVARRGVCSRRGFPDLAIVDLGLPDGDGLELLRAGARRRSGRRPARPRPAAARPVRPRGRARPAARRSSAAATTIVVKPFCYHGAARADRRAAAAHAAPPGRGPAAGRPARARPARPAGLARRRAGAAVQEGVRAAARARRGARPGCSRARSCCGASGVSRRWGRRGRSTRTRRGCAEAQRAG